MMKRLSQLWSGTTPSRPPCGAKVQLMSDLHLEVNRQYQEYDFPVSAPFLVLGGDIGRLIDYEPYLGFLTRQTKRFEKVFLVLGNHEFYGMDYESGIEKAKILEKEEALSGKLILLHRRKWDDEKSELTIVGCTLWSHVEKQAEDVVRSRVSDHRQIQKWTIEQHNSCHAEDAAWLKEAVTSTDSSSRTIFVVTHHAPCFKGTSRPDHVNNPWKSAYATEILGQKEFRDVAAWAFGHTHHTTDFMRGNVRVVANQRGSVLGVGGPSMQDNSSFTSDRVIEL